MLEILVDHDDLRIAILNENERLLTDAQFSGLKWRLELLVLEQKLLLSLCAVSDEVVTAPTD